MLNALDFGLDFQDFLYVAMLSSQFNSFQSGSFQSGSFQSGSSQSDSSGASSSTRLAQPFKLNHPITDASFAIIDQEIGAHPFSPEEYAIVRRVIHSTADFDFKELLRFSPGAIAQAISALQQGIPIITDVSMVKQGIQTLVTKTFQNPIGVAIDQAPTIPPEGKTRTEMGMLQCLTDNPHALFVVGNAPTALLALCSGELQASCVPSLVIGAPVGFVSVLESKAALAHSPFPHIRVEGRKGGSPVAAAIVNALLVLAWEQRYASTHAE